MGEGAGAVSQWKGSFLTQVTRQREIDSRVASTCYESCLRLTSLTLLVVNSKWLF